MLNSVIFMHPTWKDRIGHVFARFPVRLPAADAPLPDEEYEEFLPRGYRGDIVEAKLVPAPATPGATPPQDVDLVAMARWAMQYLIHNPSKERGFETRFGIMPLRCPPCPRLNEFDPVAVGDTENRMDWEWIFMREISGSDEGREIEAAIWQRILGYVRDDGLSWCRPYCLFNFEAAECAMNWTTGETLVSLVERHRRSGDEEQIRLAKKLVDGLRSLATWDTGRAYYEGGLDGWLDGKFLGTSIQQQYPSILEPIVRYWEATQDPEALEFAIAFADGQVAGLQTTAGANRINADGTFTGWNSHLHMRPVLGVAHLGALLKEPRYLDWSRRTYEHLRSMGTDWGWFPESPNPHHPFSETCNTADMTDVALWLARAGHTEYWDHVERYVRNYTVQAQWFVTPEYEALYRDIHRDNPAGAEEGLELMRAFSGGIHACLSPNGMAWAKSPDGMNGMGCCPPEGMRTIYTAWSNTVLETERGVEVNLAFNRDHPAARVISFLPHEGRLTVIARKRANYLLRPPSWTPRGEVKTYLDGEPIPAAWKGDHVLFARAKPGQELTITYPLVDVTQVLHVADHDYTYRWLGNTVLSVEPKNEWLPIFAEVPRKLPKLR
ncbi:MAG: hypothetical protein FJX74_09920 [Armatimonadetes bacterium]|nr:hypothetical protein [Armatimonadota bacterium]